MRTTIDIEDDVLAATKELARLQNVSAGFIVSKLVREALAGHQSPDAVHPPEMRSVGGFRPFPVRGGVATNDLVNNLRDLEGV
ncbi:MAG: CopG family transcriptional regulator [Sulfuricellaceae bacterium]